ncbi:ATP-binding cassette domain-containing protein [Alphaproteobacteria bacterium LSUCC0684]
MTEHQAKIECRGVWKIFGERAENSCREIAARNGTADEMEQAALDHGGIIGAREVSFDVAPGELFVIMGLSGSGKSTVLRSIAQLQRPTIGEVLFDGADLVAMGEEALRDIRRRKMGMVFQHFGLVPHFTALQNIAFPLKVRGEDQSTRDAKAREMLELVGLEGRGDAFPNELSGGQQQRIGIARSLAVDPELWLLDEPFSALDPLIRRQLQDELLDLQASLRKSIIFITHDFAEAVRLADRIAIMRDGRIIQQGSAASLLLHPADDYVRSFVRDVPRLQVLKLKDIMTPASRIRTDLALPMTASLEEAMLAMGDGGDRIKVCDEKGQTIGKVMRADILATVAANQ